MRPQASSGHTACQLTPVCLVNPHAPSGFTFCRPVLVPPQVEDRPVMKERVTRVREHRPVEKEFVVGARLGSQLIGCHI